MCVVCVYENIESVDEYFTFEPLLNAIYELAECYNNSVVFFSHKYQLILGEV